MNQDFQWESFKNSILSFSEKGKTIYESKLQNNDELEAFSINHSNWKNEVKDFLVDSFNSENYYVQNFRGSISRFNFNTEKSIEQKIKEKKEDLNRDIQYLDFILNMVSISDLLTKPNEIDLVIRRNYTSDEILDLILEKLYDLYGDGMYPVIQILEGNGIVLKKQREEFDYITALQNYGYVESSNIARYADAQLTLDGKRHVEEKRKIIKPNYNGITNDSDELNSKIDNLKIQLEKLGYGQQVIFDELEELKELYTLLNKKNWAQLFKGKLVDLGLSQVITTDTMKMMYEGIVHDVLRI